MPNIRELKMSVRATNALYRGKINTVDDLLALDVEDIARIRGIGRKSLSEICERISKYKEDSKKC